MVCEAINKDALPFWEGILLSSLGWVRGSTKAYIGQKSISFDGHTHDDRYFTETEVNNLLSGKAASSHSHSASQITSGTLPVARGGTGVTSISALKNILGISGGTGVKLSQLTETDYSDNGFAVPDSALSAKLLHFTIVSSITSIWLSPMINLQNYRTWWSGAGGTETINIRGFMNAADGSVPPSFSSNYRFTFRLRVSTDSSTNSVLSSGMVYGGYNMRVYMVTIN